MRSSLSSNRVLLSGKDGSFCVVEPHPSCFMSVPTRTMVWMAWFTAYTVVSGFHEVQQDVDAGPAARYSIATLLYLDRSAVEQYQSLVLIRNVYVLRKFCLAFRV